MNGRRGLLHHQNIIVSNVARSAPFYAAMLGYLGYELSGSHRGEGHEYDDWRRNDLDAPHEFGIGGVSPEYVDVPYRHGAVGHHTHVAFNAADRADVDRFYADVLVPLEQQGLCRVEDPPGDCPEYGEPYYATFFYDPDGLKYEFVFTAARHRRK
ncbi:VOC family protein [Horticoccus luteus]|uniref:VOC family protein n=1 Tax=Horticoccus luteus TaxID=2862869 RepID=A0A8F9TU19_9BACT|nr:VOC family protein [Horticoccus luteus]QYM78021.1 VOC family protein [Horticoccus luteus]